VSAAALIVVATEVERPAGNFEILVSGVGKTAAAVVTAERLAVGPPVPAIVSFGVAGAYPSTGLVVGDVVIATEVALVDEGLDAGSHFVAFSRPGMEVPGGTWTPTDSSLARRLASGAHRLFTVKSGRVATVSVCAGTHELARERSRDGAIAESMEGAAVAYAARRRGVPFIELRGISNLCGPRSGAPFEIASAVRHAAEVLAALEGLRAEGWKPAAESRT
jgi:futalosine hydrolase